MFPLCASTCLRIMGVPDVIICWCQCRQEENRAEILDALEKIQTCLTAQDRKMEAPTNEIELLKQQMRHQ